MKKDNYSLEVKKLVANEPNIVLTGYIDESTKLDLYLNAMGLLSPSLVEGFGIPVLDGACLEYLRSPAIANLTLKYKPARFQRPCDYGKYSRKPRLAAAMQSIAGLGAHHLLNDAKERRRRICRYEHYSSQVIEQYQEDLAKLMQP